MKSSHSYLCPSKGAHISRAGNSPRQDFWLWVHRAWQKIRWQEKALSDACLLRSLLHKNAFPLFLQNLSCWGTHLHIYRFWVLCQNCLSSSPIRQILLCWPFPSPCPELTPFALYKGSPQQLFPLEYFPLTGHLALEAGRCFGVGFFAGWLGFSSYYKYYSWSTLTTQNKHPSWELPSLGSLPFMEPISNLW